MQAMATSYRKSGAFGSSGGPAANEADVQQPGKPAKGKTVKACKAKLLTLLAGRDYSTHAMKEKLLKAGFTEAMADEAIKMAVDARLMDDVRYAGLFISSKSELGWGRKKIEAALERQGIDCRELEGYPDGLFSADSELARALRSIRGHKTRAKNERDAHYRYLLSRGYSPDVCARALREYYSGAAAGEYDL